MAKINKKLVAIVGPTASGKTSLGVFLAKKYDGEIVSADSRQVFRRLNIGTGKEGQPMAGNDKFLISNDKLNPNDLISKTGCHSDRSASRRRVEESLGKIKTSSFEKISRQARDDKEVVNQLRKNTRTIDGIPQWMIDICKPGEKFTLFDWLDKARVVIDDIFARGKIPVVVGGTGLYVQALVEGFQLEPGKSQIINRKSQTNSKIKTQKFEREQLNGMSLAQLQSIFKKLETINYKLETIDMQNPRRLIRAIEKAQNAETSLKIKPDFEVIQIALEIPREELYKIIDDRVEKWFSDGFYEEVQNLLKSGISPDWLDSIGLEYRILGNFIISHPEVQPKDLEILLHQSADQNDDKVSQDDRKMDQGGKDYINMKQEMKYKIHQYARRQLTWFRRFPEVVWVQDRKEASSKARDFLQK